MKILTLFLFASCLQLSAHSYAQGISLSLNNVSLNTVFAEIQQQTPYHFVFTTEQLAGASKVTINVQNGSLDKILEQCFKDQALTYSIEDKYVIVKTKERKINAPPVVEDGLRGKILNEKDEPIEGVSVSIKGTQKGTVTNAKGEFVLPVVPAGVIITVSSIGYEPKEMIIGNNRYLTIHLEAAVNALEETIIKGYYSTSRKLNTGSVSKITTEDIQKQPVSNPLLTLEGRMPGVYVQQTTGVPGGSVNIQIRGRNSLRGDGNFPLYIVDGNPYTSASLSSGNTATTVFGGAGNNPLDYINPADIESIEVLKDADATAIYGSRGANGIILITTKKGKAGKTRFDVNYYNGWGRVAHQLDLLNTQQYLQVRHEAFRNDGSSPGVPDNDINGNWDTTRNTDWQKTLLGNTSTINNAQVSISGGNVNTQFLFGAGYYRETTVFSNNFYSEKASGHFTLNHITDNKRFTAAISLNYLVNNNNLPQTDFLRQALALPPDAPALYDSSGQLNWQQSTWSNPAATFRLRYKGNTNNLITNTTLSYILLPGLTIKSSFGYTYTQLKEVSLIPISAFDPAYQVATGTADFAGSDIKTWLIEPQLQYDNHIGQGKISILLGTTFQENITDAQTIRGSGFTNDALLENIGAAASINLSNANFIQYKYNAFFGRVNYDWKQKYLLNLTGRRDGSSRFGPGKQFGNFGAIGAAWIFSNEQAVSGLLPFLSFGKLRASYGLTGNDQIPDYQYLSTYSPSYYTYQGNSTLIPNRLVNPDYSWETNKKLELALEAGFIKDRIFVEAAFYHNRSANQLVGYTLPVVTGFASVESNLPATVQNNGWEFALSTTNINSAAFSWKSSVNLTIPSNKLVYFPDIAGSSYASTYQVGRSLYVQNLYHVTGIDPKTGIYNIQDVDGNGVLDENDLQFLKEIKQQWYGGFQNNIKYKGFQLSVFFQFVKQTGMYPLNNPPGNIGNEPVDVLNHWTAPGDDAVFGKYSQDYSGDASTAFNNAWLNGDKAIVDASFVRLKNLSLSWQLPAGCLKKIKFDNARIYLQAQNLLTFTHYKGIDPETQNFQQTPPLRVISTGVQFIF